MIADGGEGLLYVERVAGSIPRQDRGRLSACRARTCARPVCLSVSPVVGLTLTRAMEVKGPRQWGPKRGWGDGDLVGRGEVG